jgi:hypothetical protein
MDNKTDIEFKVGDQAYTKPGYTNFIGEEKEFAGSGYEPNLTVNLKSRYINGSGNKYYVTSVSGEEGVRIIFEIALAITVADKRDYLIENLIE